jgi:hypothetical protein
LEFVAGTTGDFGGGFVVFKHSVGHAGFGEDDFVGAEGVGFNGVATDVEKCFVNFLDDIGAAEVENFGNILLAEPISLHVQGAGLEIGAHRAIEDDDALLNQIEKRFSIGHCKTLSIGGDEDME